MYKLINEEDNKRIYRSDTTGTEVSTRVIFTDKGGSRWWCFEDLIQIPFIRKMAAQKYSELFGAGLTPNDFDEYIENMKTVLKEDKPDKYERAFAEVLWLEDLKNKTVDPVKQCLSLSVVYILADDEPIDVFSNKKAQDKMEYWSLEPECQSFFLNFLTDGMNNLTKLFGIASQIATKEHQ